MAGTQAFWNTKTTKTTKGTKTTKAHIAHHPPSPSSPGLSGRPIPKPVRISWSNASGWVARTSRAMTG